MQLHRRVAARVLAIVALAYVIGGGGQATVAVFSSAHATSSTFTAATSFDRVSPQASDVQTVNAGLLEGTAEAGDRITFTFSEPMDPASILAGWNGSATAVVVRITNDTAGDVLTVRSADNTAQLALGWVNLHGTLYALANRDFGATGTQSTMTMFDSAVIVTLGTPSGALGTELVGANMTWTPGAAATDLAGNACLSAAVDEQDASADVEF